MHYLGDKICEKTIDSIKGIVDDSADVLLWTDNSEQRGTCMVMVGIDGAEQMNDYLDDFKFSLKVYVDSIISEDEDASLFKETTDKILAHLLGFAHKERNLDELFQELPVVGFIFDNYSYSSNGSSSQCIINFTVITSE